MQTWKAAVATLKDEGGSCSLWLDKASVAALPSSASRHNTPSRAHSLTRLVLSEKKKAPQVAVIVSGRDATRTEGIWTYSSIVCVDDDSSSPSVP